MVLWTGLLVCMVTLLPSVFVQCVQVLQTRDWLKEVEATNDREDIVKIDVSIVNRASSGNLNSEHHNKFDLRSRSNSGVLRFDVEGFWGPQTSIKKEAEKNNANIQELKVESESRTLLSPNDVNSLTANPPPHDQVAKMARFIVSQTNWTSMATISTRNSILGYPFANIFSFSDGPLGNSTGIPYMYLTPLEMSVIDLQDNDKASLTMSLAQTEYCWKHGYDPEDPRCAHIILTGNIMKIANSSSESIFAKESLFSRHPEMHEWPAGHGWFFAKLNISSVLVLDYFGGVNTVSQEDYFKAGINE